jgi:hypothetical protein
MNQLSLLPSEEAPVEPWRKWRTVEQEAAFQNHLAGIRQQAQEILAIAHEQNPGKHWDRLTEVRGDEFSNACREYHRRQGTLMDTLPLTPPISLSKPSRPYIPWSLERKQRERVKKLLQRISKRYSLIDLFVDAVQDELLSNPQYFGVCPLPGSADSCKIVLRNLVQETAIAYEQQLRLTEHLPVEPLAIPLAIKQPEYALQEMQTK